MLDTAAFTLAKEERVSSKRLIDELFTGSNSRSMVAFPIRLVYMQVENDHPQAQILVSVSKRYFKKVPKQCGKCFVMAFIWLDDHLRSSEVVERKVVKLLQGLSER